MTRCMAGRTPVRLWMTLEDNMNMFGKRNPYVFDYEVGREEFFGFLSIIYNFFLSNDNSYTIHHNICHYVFYLRK